MNESNKCRENNGCLKNIFLEDTSVLKVKTQILERSTRKIQLINFRNF